MFRVCCLLNFIGCFSEFSNWFEIVAECLYLLPVHYEFLLVCQFVSFLIGYRMITCLLLMFVKLVANSSSIFCQLLWVRCWLFSFLFLFVVLVLLPVGQFILFVDMCEFRAFVFLLSVFSSLSIVFFCHPLHMFCQVLWRLSIQCELMNRQPLPIRHQVLFNYQHIVVSVLACTLCWTVC